MAQTSKEPACNAGDLASIPGSARSPEEGNGNPLQYSCLEHFMDRGAWRATVHGIAKSQTRLPPPDEFGGETNIQSVATPLTTHIHLHVVYRLPSCYNTKDE